ncbi:MAG: hypothetical protein GY868_09910 [Deltaproteobacteria bacterium]|nr:hypothetical protein [Deltaproteobacteria bacterium]
MAMLVMMKEIVSLLMVFFLVFLFVSNVHAYPVKVQLITKTEARYDTPENAYVSMLSALVNKDIGWYYETMTKESAQRDKKELQESMVDPSSNFDLVSGMKDEFIVGKVNYKNGVLLVCKSYEQNGSISKGPAAFVLDSGKWKYTDEFSSDEIIWNYMDLIPKLFDGQTRLPAGANTFLAYANPLELRTEVQTSTFPLHVFYGETIDPATFKVEFNNTDIVSRFTPQPVGDEIVVLDLQQGKNTLVLSIEGIRESGRRSTDRDTLLLFYRPK